MRGRGQIREGWREEEGKETVLIWPGLTPPNGIWAWGGVPVLPILIQAGFQGIPNSQGSSIYL